MRQTRYTLFVMLFAGGLASACTAIVAGKLSDTSDYGTASGTSSSSGSSSGDPDPCSLLYDNNSGDRDANACSDCITTSCKDPVAYFCQDGRPTSYLSNTLASCAQSPWNGRSPPGSGASFYACTKFATTTEVPNDPTSEGAHEAVANNCINANCMQGGAPPCRLCEVSIQKPGSGSDYALMKNDACGSCVAQACAAELSSCCDTQPMNDYVQYCAYTALSKNKTACLALANADPEDAGPNNSYGYQQEDKTCLSSLKTCFASCFSKCQAVTTGQ